MKKRKKGNPKKILLFVGLSLLLFSLAVAVLVFTLQYDDLWGWYSQARETLIGLEARIAEIRQVWLFVLVILLLFLMKNFIPYPLSSVCFLTGIVLPMYVAIPVNITGISMLLASQYFWGKRFGPGYSWKFLRRWETLSELVEHDGSGNPMLLAALRLTPFVPINSVSKIYGSLNFSFWHFLVLSLLGLLPRLISFTFVGRNLFDPLSPGFLVPLAVISFISGISLLSVNGVWFTVERINKRKQKRKKKGFSKDDADNGT